LARFVVDSHMRSHPEYREQDDASQTLLSTTAADVRRKRFKDSHFFVQGRFNYTVFYCLVYSP
jgi:hypothetical protein